MKINLPISMAVLLIELFTASIVAATSSADPEIGTGYTGAHKGEITLSWKGCLKDATNLTLTATRASGDKDTYCDSLIADSLKSGWPRWKATAGDFVSGDDTGTTVHWNAPSTEQDVTFDLYEDDQATATHTSDDTDLADYGQKQDSNTVRVTIIAVDLTVRTSGNTTNSSPGPDSRGKLGLWNDHLAGKNDMKKRCENQTTGDTVNGGASYTGSHDYAVGTGLKTEMYGHITDRAGIPDATVETNGNWRIYQQRKGGVKLMGTSPLPTYASDWTDESDSPFAHCGVHTTFDLTENYLYNEDCPRLTESGLSGADGTFYTFDTDFRTWISFYYSGTWHRVTPREKWGMKAKLLKSGGAWTVDEEAAAKTYDD